MFFSQKQLQDVLHKNDRISQDNGSPESHEVQIQYRRERTGISRMMKMEIPA
jgi:hypothetical protein